MLDASWTSHKYAPHKCAAFHDTLPMESWSARLKCCCKQMLNLMVAKNSFGVNNLFSVLFYALAGERGESIKWYSLSLRVRKSKAVTPFQHAEAVFLQRPSVCQLEG